MTAYTGHNAHYTYRSLKALSGYGNLTNESSVCETRKSFKVAMFKNKMNSFFFSRYIAKSGYITLWYNILLNFAQENAMHSLMILYDRCIKTSAYILARFCLLINLVNKLMDVGMVKAGTLIVKIT